MEANFNDKLDFIIYDADLVQEFQDYLKQEDLELNNRARLRHDKSNKSRRNFIRGLMLKGITSQDEIIDLCKQKRFYKDDDNIKGLKDDITYLQDVLEIDIDRSKEFNQDQSIIDNHKQVIKHISKLVVAGKSNQQIKYKISTKYKYTHSTISTYIKVAKEQLATYGIETRLDILFSLERTKIVFLVKRGYKMGDIAKMLGVNYHKISDRFYTSKASKAIVDKRKQHYSTIKAKAYELYNQGLTIYQTIKLLDETESTIRRLYNGFDGNNPTINKSDKSIRKRAFALFEKGFNIKDTTDILCASRSTINGYHSEFKKQHGDNQ